MARTGRKRKIEESASISSSSNTKNDVVIAIDDEDSDSEVDKDKTPSMPQITPSTIAKSLIKKTAESSLKKNDLGKECLTHNGDDVIDLKIPMSLLMTGTSAGSNECSVLVQVSPEDSPTLDFHGASGAVGRFEVNGDTVTMDLKGYQYQGGLQPGPTCIIASMHPLIGQNMMKVESITDEFITLQKTGDQLAILDAVIEKGEMDDSFKIKDTNVNSRNHSKDTNGRDTANDDVKTKSSKSKNSKKKR